MNKLLATIINLSLSLVALQAQQQYVTISTSDTIWLIGDNVKIPFLNDTVLTIAGVGENFRLIIPNTVTIRYNVNDLTLYTPEPETPDPPTASPIVKAGNETSKKWLENVIPIIALIIGILVGIAVGYFVLRKLSLKKDYKIIRYDGTDLERWVSEQKTSIELLKQYNRKYRTAIENISKKIIGWDDVPSKLDNKKLKVKQYDSIPEDNQAVKMVRYHGGSLRFFAEDYAIPLAELIRLNPEIPANYSFYGRIARWIIRKELSGKELIIKQKPPDIQKIEYKSPVSDNSLIINKIDDSNKYLGEWFRFIEGKIEKSITEMQQLKPTEEFNNFISSLQAEVANKTKAITHLEGQLHEKYSELNRAEQEKTQLMAHIANIQKTILPAGFLRNYAAQVYDYLIYCQQTVYKSAVKLYNDLKQPEIAGLLLLNFETATFDLQTNKWLQVLSEIKERGIIVTSNRGIIESFTQPQNENEKLREFKRYLYNELLLIYCSSILILAEAFRNLNCFGIEVSESGFADFVRNIRNKAGGIGMTVKYVPLFEKATDYLSSVKSVGSNVSRAYSTISLQRDYIAEIVSYGIVTEFDDSEKTQIKLS